jgi:hypothetical protein
MNDQNPPPPPEPTWTERQLARAAKPEPMQEADYAHMLRVHDDTVTATDPLTGEKVAARLSPEAASYLGFLRACPAPRMAREAAGVSSGSVANWRRQIEGFAALEREAVQDAKDTLLASAYNRAVHGVLKPVFQLGNLVGYEREYSDKLMEVLLKGMREEFKPEPPKEAGTTTNIVITDPAAIGDVVRRLSPTSQPKQAQAIEIEAPKPESTLPPKIDPPVR